MKKGLSKSTRSPEKPVRRKRKYDEEFKQQALAMGRNRQTARLLTLSKRDQRPSSISKDITIEPAGTRRWAIESGEF